MDALMTSKKRKYVMVSGKGGVGKTSLSASLAVKFAGAGHDTLVVSTDPAHSLGDSLGQSLKGGKPVAIEGTDLPIWGMEIDPDKATEEFKLYAQTGGKEKVKGLLDRFGMGALMESLSELKLDELLNSPPPGLDEAVAISKVVEFVEAEEYARFTRIIFDTAPTGHTLRMLTLPDFVGSTLRKVSELRGKLGAAGNVLQALFGSQQDTEAAESRLEVLQQRVQTVSDLFRDEENMDFVIATIPTVLAVKESKRLLAALREEGVPTRSIIVNQVIGEHMGDAYIKMKLREQSAAMDLLAGSPALRDLAVTRGRLLDLEVRGVPALQYFGSAMWQDIPAPGEERKFYLLGGKGGVGKTSLSAALAVRMAAEGVPTLVVSTDPAHSLSDSLEQDVSGGAPVRVTEAGLPLWGMEIDPEEARNELRELAAGDGGAEAMSMLNAVGMGKFAEQLQDLKLGELLDNPPPGVDEAVAVSKVVRFMRNPDFAHFKCVIFDTAPTGHTLRLLTLPDFLEQSVGKIVRLRFAIAKAVSGVTNFFSGGKSGQAIDKAMNKLTELQGAMDEARQLFRDESRTEFIIVSIPTVMAMAESERLAASLRTEHVPVKRIVVNQMVDDAATEKFLQMRRADQQRALAALRADPAMQSLDIIEAPLLDLEVRGIAALQYFGSQVWKDA